MYVTSYTYVLKVFFVEHKIIIHIVLRRFIDYLHVAKSIVSSPKPGIVNPSIDTILKSWPCKCIENSPIRPCET